MCVPSSLRNLRIQYTISDSIAVGFNNPGDGKVYNWVYPLFHEVVLT